MAMLGRYAGFRHSTPMSCAHADVPWGMLLRESRAGAADGHRDLT